MKKLFVLFVVGVAFLLSIESEAKEEVRDEKAIIKEVLQKGEPVLLTRKILYNLKERPVQASDKLLSGIKVSFTEYSSKIRDVKLLTTQIIKIGLLFPKYNKYMFSKKIYIVKNNVISAKDILDLFEKDIETLKIFRDSVRNRMDYSKSDSYNNKLEKKEDLIDNEIEKIESNRDNLGESIDKFKKFQEKYNATGTNVNDTLKENNLKIREQLIKFKEMEKKGLISRGIYDQKASVLMKEYKKESSEIADDLIKLKEMIKIGLISKEIYNQKASEFMGVKNSTSNTKMSYEEYSKEREKLSEMRKNGEITSEEYYSKYSELRKKRYNRN